ncbi:MAG: hypothetical protein CML01_11315 [Pseudomonas sp.]|nr:hypothetical protein [Pseudomonas sp.]|tara:strand:- start:16705 stop:16953 length:249 start_codon:yes stop_codon:yes gene_type:complete
MQHTDKAIAEFEAWWDRQPHREQFESMKTQMRNVWVASRRELVIRLPAKPDADTFTRVQSAYWQGIDKVAGQAEAAGVTVRG